MTDPVVTRLRAAGCVFAEDEARELREAATSPDHLDALLARRVDGEPLEYVVGFAEFDGLRIAVSPGVFVPRRRTAFLVRTAAARAPANATCLDLCCGSGALGAAFAARVPGSEVHAADIDPVAVRCARHTLPPGRVYESDLFATLPAALRGRVDVLLANVPYVPTAALASMPVEARDHEPPRTHDGGPDGLDIARRVLAEAAHWLAPGGVLYIEIAEHQRDAARTAVESAGLTPRLDADDDLGATIVSGTNDRPEWSSPARAAWIP
ncbi:release factor glutamine methyltransferase [Jatrophihabitans endophyticus]|uniref:peptide chain release factor N(5)-glutamine methyltransferase n=1 Tax=Jatrophihabitans endophyticus TaxID=1206085 RepID=A0A1M5S789_9ACTN|nr:putative protein N(5)-glutamine methyltransferase [Jatrophihabitans endophyticus]SHH34315.1 release factor glutamine methyltransferase [Jatrophihabitans endophyticus]